MASSRLHLKSDAHVGAVISLLSKDVIQNPSRRAESSPQYRKEHGKEDIDFFAREAQVERAKLVRGRGRIK